MDMQRAARLRRINEAEDSARELHHRLAGWNSDVPMTKGEGVELAEALINGLQAISEML